MAPDKLVKISEYIYEIPQQGDMLVPGRVYISEKLLEGVEDGALEQVKNVASLPGIVGFSIGMPDIHWGYGFPIGGVAAFDAKDGVITPGGIGFDINCGVRIMLTPFSWDEVEPRLDVLLSKIYAKVPAGVGAESDLKLKRVDMERVLKYGARWAVENGMGFAEDLESIESGGMMPDADPDEVSDRAFQRGKKQLGTLGAGNHFLEIQVVEKVFRPDIAERWGLRPGGVVVMIHTGSRGLGHQVATDWIKTITYAMKRYGIKVKDRQLAAVPFASDEGQAYFRAMAAAANFAWANRQIIMHRVREAFKSVFGISASELPLLYDVAHNIGKLERHVWQGSERLLIVHRKGATRAFPAGHPELSDKFKDTGQPVLMPGDMGTASYVLVGLPKSMELSFGTSAHGAGRILSRKQALKRWRGEEVVNRLSRQGILVKAVSRRTVAEESPEAYKDIDEVVKVIERLEIAGKVSRHVPKGVVKG